MTRSGGENAIEVHGLTKRYGRTTAVEDVSFDARWGAITGFLGPNGAGKSTTMRMMVGLASPTAGHATVLGVDYRRLPDPGRQAGVLLDASAQHPGRAGREVLHLAATVLGLPDKRVDEVLTMVGLTPAEARRRTGGYSLGMRQRLGIGHALLGQPRVLILDEPANGLDPAGIHWMRGLLRGFADEGGSVLLSSHLLHEVEVLADDLVVVGGGSIVARGRKSDLLATAGTFCRSADLPGLAAALREAGLAFTRAPGDSLTVSAPPGEVARAAMAAGIVLEELRPAAAGGLEEIFLRLTADHAREDSMEGARR
ncbi:ATP-binding cassette domain-containing protein [Actinoplanes subtropicus]|uniref:ATP-binding cassette domain-containing protein n=1 Tax=Actinoplanes subtropicus TaxID=543632 RepID=UPI0004C3B406|nr:ATP-binding cassette domain-containing protein [Actinoplanes subtropicus]